MGFATEDPLVYREESRPHVLEEIEKSQMTYSPNYMIDIKKNEIKSVYFCFPSHQKDIRGKSIDIERVLSQSVRGDYFDFECTILIKMLTPGEVLKYYGPSCKSKFFEKDIPSFIRSVFKLESSGSDFSKNILNYWNMKQVYAINGITSHDLIIQFKKMLNLIDVPYSDNYNEKVVQHESNEYAQIMSQQFLFQGRAERLT